MKLNKLKLKNIRSYETEEIVFPEGSTLLSGDIGSGKTSVLLAVEYALFGLQPGQRGSSLLANGEQSGSVSLELEINGKSVIIERSLKRGSKSITQDAAVVTIDGERTESSVTEIKTKILELLNYPKEFIKKNNLLFRYTVYTPQEEMKQIILEDAESRLNILRHVFGIDKYKRIKENLSRLGVKLREESKLLQGEIKDLDESKNKLESSKKFVNLLKEKIGKKKSELEQAVEERKGKESELKEIEGKIKEKEVFMKEVEKTTIVLAGKREQLRKDEETLKELQLKIEQDNGSFDQQLYEKTIQEIQSGKYVLDDLNKKFIEYSSRIRSFQIRKEEDLQKKNRIFKIDICPTCLQDVSETHKHNILNDTEKQIRSVEKNSQELHQKVERTNKEIELGKEKVLLLEKEKSRLELLRVKLQDVEKSVQRIKDVHRTKENVEKDISFLEKHIEALKQSTLEFTKFDNLYNLQKEKVGQAFESEKKIEIEAAELRKEHEITKREIGELEEKIEKTEKVKERLIGILEIEGWLSGEFRNLVEFTERNIMLTLRNEFSKLFNKWFGMLTTDSFFVRLDENFTPVITQGDFELDYAFLSGGERTAVALAYRLALNQILNSLLSNIKTQGLVILDEPTDGFSDQQLDKVRDILQELHATQLIMVSHEQKIESFVDNIIRFRKEGGVSRKEEP